MPKSGLMLYLFQNENCWWRSPSFGSQSEAGTVFVERMLTVVTSLRSQNRNVLEFMTEEPFAPLGGAVLLPLRCPRRVLPLSQ